MAPTIDRVLVDLGGVLTVDPWETLLLTPGTGIADRMGLDRALVERVGLALWDEHSRSVTSESLYWRQFSAQVGAEIHTSLVNTVERELLVVTPDAHRIVACLRERSAPWGLITNNTAFWYPKQLDLLGMTPADPQWHFTSFAAGVEKGDDPGLFELAAGTIDAEHTAVIDDRPSNVERAQRCGFQATMYRVGDVIPFTVDCKPQRSTNETTPETTP